MPFPWKKAKVTRFSRLVADLHQSPKRCGSLVVETGFPTSLIDLFVKNRDRLRKRKPRSQIRTSHTTHQPPPPSPLQSSPSHPPCNEELQTPQIVLVKRDFEEKEETKTFSCDAVFKFLLVVALAFSVRNLVLWFMMVAFSLVVIESVGTLLFGFSIPESNKTVFWDCWARKGLLVLNRYWDKEQKQGSSLSSSSVVDEELVVKEEGNVSHDSPELIEFESESDRVEEIEIADSESDCQSLKVETSIREMLTCETERSSRRARIKTGFINKFVPKKMRHGKKQGKSSSKKSKDESCS